MAVEKVTSSIIQVNGYLVELFDDREHDMFDQMVETENSRLQQVYPKGLHDSVFNLRRTAGLTTFDPLYAAYQQVPRFIDLAKRAAEEQAVSYRDFKVGASACAFDDMGMRIGYFFGANYKPSPNADKYCAELDIVQKVRASRFNRIVALAVFGPSEFADVDPFPSPTLHPCRVCRTMLDEDPLFKDNPLIVTTNQENDLELFMTDELVALHA